MPLYLDVHRNLENVKPSDVAGAHVKDMSVQDKYGVYYHKYWFNEKEGSIFCLVEGPDAATCERVHAEAHGLVADDMIEVEPRLVDLFLQTGTNMDGAAINSDGSLDTGFRVVVFTEVANFAEVAGEQDHVGVSLMHLHDEIVRHALLLNHGREIKHTDEGIMACFSSVSTALRFAETALARCEGECDELGGHKPLLRIGITAGEPVESNRDLFGVSVTAARHICSLAPAGGVLVSGAVRELAVGKGFKFSEHNTAMLKGIPEPVSLFSLQVQLVRTAAAPVALLPAVAVSPRRRRTVAIRQFWSELKRRHVVTVAAVYLAVVFGMLQVAQLTFEPLGLPEWAYTLILVIGIFGLPLALVLAWAFDLNVTANRETD